MRFPNFSATVVGAGFLVLAAAIPAKSVTLSYDHSIGSPGHAPGQLFVPQGIDVQPGTGDVFIGDEGNNRVDVFNPNGTFIKSIGSAGSGPGQFNEPVDLIFSHKTGDLYVADVLNNRIDVFNPQGDYLKSFGSFAGPLKGRPFYGPGGLAFDPSGNLYVTDYSADKIKVFNSADQQIDSIGSSGTAPGQFLGPAGISISSTGNLYVGDQLNNRVQVLTLQGQPLLTFGETGSAPGQFLQPIGVQADEAGNIYVADSINNRVQVFNPKGQFLTAFGKAAPDVSTTMPGPIPPGSPLPPPGEFYWTAGLHYANSKLYVGDFFNGRIQVLNVSGQTTAVPEPSSTLGIALLGIGVIAGKVRQQRRKATSLGEQEKLLSKC